MSFDSLSRLKPSVVLDHTCSSHYSRHWPEVVSGSTSILCILVPSLGGPTVIITEHASPVILRAGHVLPLTATINSTLNLNFSNPIRSVTSQSS